MDRFVARQNIEHFRRRLDEARDPALRAELQQLLAEAQDQLRQAEEAHQSDPPAVAQGEVARRARISTLVEQLRIEAEPVRRRSLRDRLIAEEDRFGAVSQRLDLVDAHIEAGVHRVQRLEAFVENLRSNGDLTGPQVKDLEYSKEILETFRSYRDGLASRASKFDL